MANKIDGILFNVFSLHFINPKDIKTVIIVWIAVEWQVQKPVSSDLSVYIYNWVFHTIFVTLAIILNIEIHSIGRGNIFFLEDIFSLTYSHVSYHKSCVTKNQINISHVSSCDHLPIIKWSISCYQMISYLLSSDQFHVIRWSVTQYHVIILCYFYHCKNIDFSTRSNCEIQTQGVISLMFLSCGAHFNVAKPTIFHYVWLSLNPFIGHSFYTNHTYSVSFGFS